jgi:hypothetical protein
MNAVEGSNPDNVMAKLSGYHRGLRSGHAFKGVTRELERAVCLLGSIDRMSRSTGLSRVLAFGGMLVTKERAKAEHKQKTSNQVSESKGET